MKYLHKILFKLFPRFYYYKDGYPKRCTLCGNSVMRKVTKATIANVPCEIYIYCNECNANTSFYAYGSYDPGYRVNGAINEIHK
jgi:hypothetical protein